jgi:hypothetical protein
MMDVTDKVASTVPQMVIHLAQEGGSAVPTANAASYPNETTDDAVDIAMVAGGIWIIFEAKSPSGYLAVRGPAVSNDGTFMNSGSHRAAFLDMARRDLVLGHARLGAFEVVPDKVLSLHSRHIRSALWFFDNSPAFDGTGYPNAIDLTEPPTAAPEAVSYVGSPGNRSVQDALIARFRLLRRLPQNHDNEGASAPDPASVDAAIAFVGTMSTSTPCSATLNDEGQAVIEFEDRVSGLYADLTFLPSGRVEMYRRQPGKESVLFEAALGSKRTRAFLVDEVDVVF